MKIHNTTDWPREKLAPYGRDITAAMHKLAARFPKDVSVPHLAAELFEGKRQLWLVLEGDEFRFFVLTQICLNEGTGHKSVSLTSLGGEDGIDGVPCIADIEAWAKEQGASEVTMVGRLGWKRAVAKQGYVADAMIYRKELASPGNDGNGLNKGISL